MHSGYLVTLHKHRIDLFDGIAKALAGKPWLPSGEPSASCTRTPATLAQEKMAA